MCCTVMLVIQQLLHRCEHEQNKPVCQLFHSPTNYKMTVNNESLTELILRVLRNNARFESGSKCKEFFIFLSCFLLFRSCELHNVSDPASGFQLTICEDKCAGVDKLYQECTLGKKLLIAVGNSTNKVLQNVASFIRNFTCSNPNTYIVPEMPVSRLRCDNVSHIDRLLQSKD